MNEIMISKRVHFRGWRRTQITWNKWIEKMELTHESIWKKAGIFNALKCSTYTFKKDCELVIGLAVKWCPETKSLIFHWGEVTVTLEDVMVLGGYSVLGVGVKIPDQMTGKDGEVKKELFGVYKDIMRNLNVSFVSHYQWMNYFEGYGGELENVALIALWLSRDVFLPKSHFVVTPSVFPLAVALARGVRVALAPAMLAAMYKDLSLLREKIMTLSSGKNGDDGSRLVLDAPLHLLQLWAWERFSTLGPKPVSLRCGEPRLARWCCAKRPEPRRERVGMEFPGDGFLWRPYALHLKNWELPKFYPDQEMWVVVDEELLSFARCLTACKMVGFDCVERYRPHRVGMQFGYDQDIPNSASLSNGNCDVGGLKLYLPPRLLEGDVTVKYANWWKEAFSLHCGEWIVYERRRRNPRKLRSLSRDIDGSKKGSEMDNPSCSSPQCNENVASVCTESSCKHRTEKPHASFEGMTSENPVNVIHKTRLVNDMNLLIGQEQEKEQCEHITEPGEEEDEVTRTKANMANGSNQFEGTHSRIESLTKDDGTPSRIRPLIVTDMDGVNGSKQIEGTDSRNGTSREDDETVSGARTITVPEMHQWCCAENAKQANEPLDNLMITNIAGKESRDDYGVAGTCECTKENMASGSKHFEGSAHSENISLNEDNVAEPLIASDLDMVHGSKPSEATHIRNEASTEDNDTLRGAHPLIVVPELTTLFCAENDNVKQGNEPLDNLVIIDDAEEENEDDCDPFRALFSDFESRISRLECEVSCIKSAKFKSTAGY